MTPIDQLALEAAKALSEKYCIDGHDAATPPDQELADLLAPFLRRAVESKWQPIETAPKDGTIILVHGGTARWNEAVGTWCSGMEEPLFRRPIEWEVTRWMPLPDAPR